MEHYAGLDISLEEASVCVMDDAGAVVWRGSVACDGAPIASALEAHAPSLQRVVLETGLLSNWLWHELRGLGVPVVCVDARHARAVLSVRIMKTDANDAESLAQLARIDWYREVKVKSEASQWLRSLLLAKGGRKGSGCLIAAVNPRPSAPPFSWLSSWSVARHRIG